MTTARDQRRSRMRRLARPLALTAAALLFIALQAAAQSTPPAPKPVKPSTHTASLQGDLLKDWTAMQDRMAKVADAMPEDKYGFKPTPAQRSFGEQMLHVASANVMLIKTLDAKAA